MATEFSQKFPSDSQTNEYNLNTIDYKFDTAIDLQDCIDSFERVIEQVPEFDEIFISNSLNNNQNINNNHHQYQLSTIAPLSSSSSSSLDNFVVKKYDTITTYLENIELDEDARYFHQKKK